MSVLHERGKCCIQGGAIGGGIGALGSLGADAGRSLALGKPSFDLGRSAAAGGTGAFIGGFIGLAGGPELIPVGASLSGAD
ncbi:MAG: hypothetical protein RLZZ135_1722 [Cyanobacteriota bacterium]